MGDGFAKIKAEDALLSPDAKETVDFLKAKKAVEQVRSAKEMENVKAEVGKIEVIYDHKDEVIAVANIATDVSTVAGGRVETDPIQSQRT